MKLSQRTVILGVALLIGAHTGWPWIEEMTAAVEMIVELVNVWVEKR